MIHSLSKEELRRLARRRRVEVLQCSKRVKDSVWKLLNDSFFTLRPDVTLRVYGHYSTECDLGFARHLTNVRHFAADCLGRAKNVGAITAIPQLKSLSLGISDLKDFDVLADIPATLSRLSLGATKSKKLSLEPLSRFRSLKTLLIEGPASSVS